MAKCAEEVIKANGFEDKVMIFFCGLFTFFYRVYIYIFDFIDFILLH